MPASRYWFGSLLFWIVFTSLLWSQEPAKKEPLTKEQKDKLQEAQKWGKETTQLRQQGKLKEAIAAAQKMLKIEQEVLGNEHEDVVGSLQQIAEMQEQLESFAEAIQTRQEILEIQTRRFGKDHWQVTDAKLTLTDLQANAKRTPEQRSQMQKIAKLDQEVVQLYQQGKFEKAIPIAQQIAELRKKLLGENHPYYASSLNNLAMLYQEMGSYAKAEPLLLQAKDLIKKLLGENHPYYASSLDNLAGLYKAMGSYAKAEPLFLQAVQKITEQLDRTAVGQTEAAQLNYAQSTRGYLDNLLDGTTKSTSPAVYEAVFRLRGLVTTRQLFARVVRQTKPELKPKIEALQSLSQQLSNLVNNPPKNVNVAKRMEELTEKREQVERELASQSEAFAAFQKRKQQTVADLQKLLPADTVVIDFLQYRTKLVAFVINKEKITRIELGEMKPLAQAIEAFRKTLDRTQPLQGNTNDPALVLKEKLWQPLTQTIGKAQLVLLCPDRELCQLPFAALPGKDPTKYLIEEVALAVIPSPQQMFDVLAPKTAKPKEETPPSLLLVGDVDFNADFSQVAAKDSGFKRKRAGEAQSWLELPATKDELVLITNLFKNAVKNGTLTELQKTQANETALRSHLGQHEFVHLATHGFFASKELTKQLEPKDNREGLIDDRPSRPVGAHPGLLSGIVLAGANKPQGEDDGVLTALEVEHLDLSKVELAVLSACETGLGTLQAGEGVMGLQRAFHLAGAKTTVTSLWKVDDEATRKLMTRFYTNYFQKNQGTLESLREAQLTMLKDATIRGKGKKLEGKPIEANTPEAKPQDRTPPFYWAAFVLAGDWR